MNNREVERGLQTHHVKAICADELIRPDRPDTYVVNTDICVRPGTHWKFHFPVKGPFALARTFRTEKTSLAILSRHLERL